MKNCTVEDKLEKSFKNKDKENLYEILRIITENFKGDSDES